MDLKPCPFCGGKAIYGICETSEKKFPFAGFVKCIHCGVKTPKQYNIDEQSAKEDAIKLWNRRTSDVH